MAPKKPNGMGDGPVDLTAVFLEGMTLVQSTSSQGPVDLTPSFQELIRKVALRVSREIAEDLLALPLAHPVGRHSDGSPPPQEPEEEP